VLRAKGYRGPATLIPQFGFDPGLFAPKVHSNTAAPVMIGYIARLVPEKGPLLLLDALQGLQGDWRLHVVGTGPSEADMRATAESLGLSDRVIWERSVPSTQVAERLRSFDLLVLPSLTQPNWKEQFGRVLVESMACEVPVVASTCGEMPNVIGDAGVIFPEGDPRALREALHSLVSDGARRRELGRLGRERVMAHYTHARIAEETVAVYGQVMRGS
jgi:glycosyltransferase involved in cell wall biosynthesis